MLSTEKDELGSGQPVLVEHVSVNQTFVTHMHREVIFPSLFVPVQSTLIADNENENRHRRTRERADQYCLATKNDIAYRKTSRVYCLDTRGVQSDRPAILKNATLAWSFEGTNSPRGYSGKAIAASYQGDHRRFFALNEVLQQPFDYRPAWREYALPARDEERVEQTFCGT